MAKIYKVFTINRGVKEGATVKRFELANKTVIPVVTVGERGRGRELGLINVQLTPESKKKFDDGETVKIFAVTISQTQSGKPKFKEADVKGACQDEAIGIFETHIGFRGSNRHTGDREDFTAEDPTFKDFPCDILISGYVAQGDAGRAGGGRQYICKIPANTVFRTAYGGRLYGAASSHYYLFDGQTILFQTWEERETSDFVLF